ncbi:MAG: glutathione S-transferase family protein [Candidatus Bathyarchaeia archaeon]
MLTLFQEPWSHWCVKARKIMDYKKIKYKVNSVGVYDKRELLMTTGQDYVPALVEGKQIITYAEIPDFLEVMVPEPSIYPNHTRGEAKAIENWAHYRLEDVVWQYVVPDFPKTFKDDIDRWVFVELQETKRGPLELLEARRPELKIQMENHLQILEEILAEHRFLLDEKPSLADFAVFGAVSPLPYSGNKLPDKFEKLAAWHDNIDRL